MNLDSILLRVIEIGHGQRAVPAVQTAIGELLGESGEGTFELDDLLEHLRRNGEAEVAELMARAVAQLGEERVAEVRTQLQAFAGVNLGPFRVRPVEEWEGAIPKLAYTGEARSSTVICSAATGDQHLRMLSVMAPTVGYYAERHGMDALLLPGVRLYAPRPPAWDKVVLLRNLLDCYETVIWIDSDAIICDPTQDIRDALDPGCPMHIVAHWYAGKLQPNTGVWVVRRDPRVVELLEEIWSREEFMHHPWWEQAALMDLIGYDPRGTSCAWFGPTPFTALVGLLDRSWNSIRQDEASDPVIAHYAGEPAEVRLTGMQLNYGRFLARAIHPRSDVAAPSSRHVRHPVGADPDAVVLPTRGQLPALLNLRGLLGRGVEVGVQRGLYSEQILRRWKGELLISVDPWMEETEGEYVDIANVSQLEQEQRYRETVYRLSRFGGRSQVWRMTSVEASALITDHSLDFVYLDARHDYTSVLEDIEAWFSKIRPGGVLAGHDYVDGLLPEGDFGVKSAVDEFFASRGLQVQVTRLDPPWVSWFVETNAGAAVEESLPEQLLAATSTGGSLPPPSNQQVAEHVG